MTAINSLEFSTEIAAFPVAETVLEIVNAGLTGSLRAERGEHKAVIYFLDGSVVYAVSNQRIHRLAQVLLEKGLVDNEFFATSRKFSSDLQLAEGVINETRASADNVSAAVGELCEKVLQDVFSWNDGKWTFSPQARLKDGIAYTIDIDRLLLEYSRSMSAETVAARLANKNEYFSLKQRLLEIEFAPAEAYIFSRFDQTPITLGQLLAISGMPADEALKAVYVLWMIRLAARAGRKSAFTEQRIDSIKSATYQKPKTISRPVIAKPARTEHVDLAELAESQAKQQADFDLEETLARIESAWNHYQVLGVEPNVKMDAIRTSYFSLAKLLHPDRFRRAGPVIAQRVEKAFTELALAHETLKTPEGRQNYDIRMRELEQDKDNGTAAGPGSKQEDNAAKEFERGFALQLNGDLESAVPHLARAVHYSPANARYHAFYGKALSADESQRLKAQNELLEAIKLEPENPAFRLLLAEFYVRYKLFKRAEGELVRLLETAPDNREAMALLDTVRAKSLN